MASARTDVCRAREFATRMDGPGAAPPWSTRPHHEARTLHDQQVTSVREGLTALKCADAGKLAFSSYCGKCRQLVLDKCKESEVLAAFKQREMETLNNARAFVQRAAEKSAKDAEKKSGAPSSSSDAAGD